MTIALTSPQLAVLRSQSVAHRSRQYISQVPATAFATARINQASFSRPLGVLTVDTTAGNWASISADMTVWIGTTAGARDIGAFRVRDASPTTLSIAELSPSDFGFLPLTELRNLADNAYLTVIAAMPACMKNSRILYSGGLDGVFYFDFDDAYGDQNEAGGETPVVVNIGKHPAGFVDPTTGQFEYVWAAELVALEAGVTVTDYLWSSGGDVLDGGLDENSVTIGYDPGYYLVSLTVTCSNGYVYQVFRHVFAHDHDEYPATPVRAIRSDRQDERLGRRMSIELDSPIDTEPLQEGMMVVIWEDARWGTTAIDDAPLNFAGWATPHSANSLPGQNIATFDIIGALELLQAQKAYAQEITIRDNPATWQDVSATLAHFDFFAFYLLLYTTTLPRIFDTHLPGQIGQTAVVWIASPGNIVDQLNEVGARVSVYVAQASDGGLWFKREFHQQTESERTGSLTRLAATSVDWTTLTYQKRLTPDVSRVEAEGFRFVAGQMSPLQSHAPGTAAGYGGQVVSLAGLLISGQDRINEMSANEYVYRNRPFESFTLEFNRNYDVLDCAWRMWVTLTVTADEWPENVPTSVRCKVTAIERRYLEGGAKDVIWTLEPEVIGYNTPGQTIHIIGDQVDIEDIETPIYDDAGDLVIAYDPYDPGTYPEVDDYYEEDVAPTTVLMAWADDALAMAVNTPSSPFWETVFEEAEAVQDALFDPSSPRLTSSRREGALEAVILTDEHFYFSENVLASPIVWEARQAVEHYTLLRAVLRRRNTFVGFGRTPNGATATLTNNFAAGIGDEWYFASVSRPFGNTDHTASTPDGQWVSSGGRGDNGGCMRSTDTGVNDGFGAERVEVTIIYDFGEEVTITAVSFWTRLNKTQNHFGGANLFDETGTLVASVASFSGTGSTTWEQRSFTGNETGVRYVAIGVSSAWTDSNTNETICFIDDASIGSDNGDAVIAFYTDDAGDTALDETAYGTRTSDGTPGDVDDHELGIRMVGGETAIYYSTTYNGAFSTMATVDAGSATITLLRIPYRRMDGTGNYNNNPNALYFIYGLDDTDGSGRTLVTGIFNSLTNAVALFNRTPVIGADTYVAVGPNCLETNALNPLRVLAFMRIDGDTQVDLLGSEDGGVTWEVRQADLPGTYVRWLTGSLNEARLATEDGVYYTPDAGATVIDITTNFAEDVDDVPTLGVI